MGFGWQGSVASKTTMPFLRLDAPSRVNTPYLPSSVVITSLMKRASVIIESTMRGLAGAAVLTADTRSPLGGMQMNRPQRRTPTSAGAHTGGRGLVGDRRPARGRSVEPPVDRHARDSGIT